MKRKSNKIKLNFLFPIVTIIGIGAYLLFSGFFKKVNSSDFKGICNQVIDSVLIAEKRNYLTSRCVGEACTTPKQYRTKNWIIKNATEQELKKLTEHSNPVIRTIGIEGLIKNNNFYSNKEIIYTAIYDTITRFKYASGCFAGLSKSMSEYVVQDVLWLDPAIPAPPPLPNGKDYIDYGISESDKKKIQNIYTNLK